MANQVFHLSNTGITSGQKFYLKDEVSGLYLRNINLDIIGNLNVTGNILVSGRSVLTGIAVITLNDLNQSFKNLYISTSGNDATAQIGNINRPYLTAQTAWNAIIGDPSPNYILNFYQGSYTISVGSTTNWPVGIGIKGLGNSRPSLAISHTVLNPGVSAPNFTITDFGYQSVNVSLTSQGGNYGGGLPSNGGNGGDISLVNVLGSTIQSLAGSAGGASRNGGVGGNITVLNSYISTLRSLGTAGTAGTFTDRGGGNISITNSTITTSLQHNSDPVNNRTINIIQSNYPSLPVTTATYNIKNSYNSSRAEAVLSSNYSGSLYYDDFSIRNNNLSGILNNLTLHDNQNRPHTNGLSNTLTIDFASGVNFSNKKIFGFVPEMTEVRNNFLISGNLNSDVIIADSPSQITGILVSGNPIGFNASIIQRGAGQIQITGSGVGIIINSYNNQYRTAGQFASVSLLHTGNNIYVMYGNTAL